MLKTKLNKPSSTSKLVLRKELIDTLEAGKEKKLILVSAPAGYGKSTAISQWIDHSSLRYAWYSLDRSDNDIQIFLQYTIAAIQSVYKNTGAEALKLMGPNSSASFETIASSIINDLYEIEEHFYIVYDDYHLIENPQINQLLSFLLNNLPGNIHIVLITRSDPAFPLARLRSQQLITDIRLSDLFFSSNSIYDFFTKGLNISLSKEDAENLENKTEGWIAGLQLAALSLQGKEDISDFVTKLKGDNRYIMDYLIEEVLQQLEPELRDFLLCTSILSQFNASLCNHLLNIDNGQDLIEHFERNNMFIIPLDNERNWFRYHHLFASLLQQRLKVEFKDRIPGLHASASQWFEDKGQLVFALEHSLASGDRGRAIDHFANVINQMWESSQYQTILQFGARFSHEELIKNADLCFNYFWILFQSGFIEKADSLINLLRSHTTDKAELAMVYVCMNNVKVFTGDIDSVYSYAELGMQHVDRDAAYWNTLAYLSLGEAQLLRFELADSFSSFDQGANIASESHLLYFELVNRTRATFVAGTLGDFSGAFKSDKDLLDKFNAVLGDNSFGSDVLTSILNSKIGNYLVDINQTEEGLQKSIRGYNSAKQTTNRLFIATSTLLLAKSYYLAGEYSKALSIVDELDAISYEKLAKYLCVMTDSMKCKLYPLINKQDKLKALFTKEMEANKNNAFERIVYSTCKARYKIEKGEILEASELLKDLAEELNAGKAYGLLIEVEILLARAYSLIQEQDKAIDYLLQAVLRTQRAGLVRIYIKEGEEIETLLKEIKHLVSTRSNPQFNEVDVEYINKLLRVFEKHKSQLSSPSDDGLSSRELDTLKLIAENLSNQEIADELYISITTVKTHVRNILLKLEAKNRNEAVVKAKESGVLPG